MGIVFVIGHIQYLIIAFAFKHFLADFVLQTEYMDRKHYARNWTLPLLCHALVHGILTFFVVSRYGTTLAVVCAVVDTVVHFTIDAIKLHIRIDPAKKSYWFVFGADQFLHYLTYFILVRWITSEVLIPLTQVAVKTAASYVY